MEIGLIVVVLVFLIAFSFWKHLQSHQVLANERKVFQEELLQKDNDLQQSRESLIRLQAEKEKTEAILTAQVKVLKDTEKEMSERFAKLSQDALQNNRDQFIHLAKTELKHIEEKNQSELDKRREAIGQMVLPIKESLEKVQQGIGEVEKLRLGDYKSLQEQIKMLSEGQYALQKETGNLVQALRRPEVRGNWGEMQLKRVIEMAGMSEHCDFIEQASVASEESRLRPDVVIKLPGKRDIIIDAKVPLDAYLSAVEAQDPEEQTSFLDKHARQIRAKIKDLQSKKYWDQFKDSPEFVILFLPNEALFRAGLERDPQLIEYGFKERVILASPSNLIALLLAIAYGWNQDKVTKNAEEIQKNAKIMYERTATFVSHFEGVGKSLDQAIGKYNSAVGSLEKSFLPIARKFAAQGISSSKEITELEDKTQKVRKLQAPELTEGTEK